MYFPPIRSNQAPGLREILELTPIRPTHSRRSATNLGDLPTWLVPTVKDLLRTTSDIQITIPDPAAIQYPEDDLDERHGANQQAQPEDRRGLFQQTAPNAWMRAREDRKGFWSAGHLMRFTTRRN